MNFSQVLVSNSTSMGDIRLCVAVEPHKKKKKKERERGGGDDVKKYRKGKAHGFIPEHWMGPSEEVLVLEKYLSPLPSAKSNSGCLSQR
jgi:hypothetical protein